MASTTATRRHTKTATRQVKRFAAWMRHRDATAATRRAASPNGERARRRHERISCSYCGRTFSEPAVFNRHDCMRSKQNSNGNGNSKAPPKRQGPFVAPAAGSGRAARRTTHTNGNSRKGATRMTTADVDGAQSNNDAILKQLNKASGAMSELDLSHAHLFDGTTQQLGQSLLLIADAVREVADQVGGIPLARQISRQYEDLAEHIAEGNERAKSIRRRFRDEYDEQLNPDKRTPPAGFFHAAGR